MTTNTVVVVGDRFDPAMVSPELLFDHAVDSGRVLIGPVAQCSFDSGRCTFSLAPGRIDLSVRSQEVMPDELRLAADRLFAILDDIRAAVVISGMGLNCDFVFPTVNRTGRDISNSLTRLDELEWIPGMPKPVQAKTSLNYRLGNVAYTLRIEPEAASEGRDLFIAVNGHQKVDSSSQLAPTLAEFDRFGSHVRNLHDNVRRSVV